MARPLYALPKFQITQDNVQLLSDKAFKFPKENKFEAVGSVVISQGPNSIYGDKATLSMQTGEATVLGNVRYVGPDMTLFGSEFDYNFKTSLFTIKNARLKSGNFILQGKKIEKISEDLIIAEGAEVTTCQDCPESWTVYGTKVKIVPNKYIYIYSGFVSIKGISFFYIPYLVFPIKKKRETGLLLPKLELSQDDGARFRLPFFWAIDDKKDMTLTPSMFGRRGFGSLFEYRQNVAEEKWFQLDSMVIWDNIYQPYKQNYDVIGDNYFRNFNNYEHTYNFGTHWNHHLNFLALTDSDQLRDFDYLINPFVEGPDTGGGGYLNYRTSLIDVNLEGYLQRNVLVTDPTIFDKNYVQILPKVLFDLNPLKIFQSDFFPFQSLNFGVAADFTTFKQMNFNELNYIRNANRTNFVPYLDYNLGQIGPVQLKSYLAFDSQYYDFPYEKQNFMLFGLGLAVIIIGYVLMGTGITDDPAKYQTTWNNPMAIAVAPFVLVVGYCVIIPLAIIRSFRKKSE